MNLNTISRVSRTVAIALLVSGVCIAVAATAAGSPIPLLTRETKLTASDAAAGGWLGFSVAISGDTAVVGVPLDDPRGPWSGSAYVFVRAGNGWIQQQKLTANDGIPYDLFGWSVAISGDTVIIGALGNNIERNYHFAAYAFVRSGGVWSQEEKFPAGDAGWSVAVSGDTAVLGSFRYEGAGVSSGAAYVFVRSGGVWIEQQKLTANDAAADDRLGWSVAISGDTAVVGAIGESDGAYLSGAAYVFVRSGGVWSQQQKLKASDPDLDAQFGYAVSVGADTAVIGAPYDDAVAMNSGAAYVFVRNGSVWSQQKKLKASDATKDDNLGSSVAVSGDSAVVGAPAPAINNAPPRVGSAYVFARDGSVWGQRQKLTASDGTPGNAFGYPVAIDGVTVLVGADGQAPSGAAYLYQPELTALSPARLWVGLKNSDDVGIRFDLQAKVYLNGFPVGSGQLDSVSGGSSGFNNAMLSSIPLTLTAPVPFSTGDTLAVEVLVRNACSGSGKNSGTARLWYNGRAVDGGANRDAGTRFDATIGGTNSDYFLRAGYALSTTAGTSRLSVDKATGARCGPFVSFGSWSTALP